jgi:hypothetical protein
MKLQKLFYGSGLGMALAAPVSAWAAEGSVFTDNLPVIGGVAALLIFAFLPRKAAKPSAPACCGSTCSEPEAAAPEAAAAAPEAAAAAEASEEASAEPAAEAEESATEQPAAAEEEPTAESEQPAAEKAG